VLTRLDIVVDNDFEDIGWKITDFAGNAVTPYFYPGYYTKAGFYSQDFMFEQPGIYVFVMTDVSGLGTSKWNFFSARYLENLSGS
jgi:hypothetical protein